MIEVEAVRVFERGEVLLVGDHEILHLLEAGVVEPERRGQVVVAKLVGNVRLFALLDVQNEDLLCEFDLGDQGLQHHDALDRLHVDDNLQLLVRLQHFVFLLFVPYHISVVHRSQPAALVLQLLFHLQKYVGRHVSIQVASVAHRLLEVAEIVDFDFFLFHVDFVAHHLRLVRLLLHDVDGLLEFEFDVVDQVLLLQLSDVQLDDSFEDVAHSVIYHLLKGVIIHSKQLELVRQIAQLGLLLHRHGIETLHDLVEY